MEWKEKGNKAFGEGKFTDAVECYSKGIEVDHSASVLWSNRAAAYYSLQKYELALSDAIMAISLQPAFVKAHFRKAEALMALKRFQEALVAYEECLMLDTQNTAVKNALLQCRTRYIDKPIKVEFISLERGRGVFAARKFKVGELIYQEEPLASIISVTSAPKGVKVCSYTMRSVLNPFTMQKPWNKVLQEYYGPGGAPRLVECPHCKGNDGYREQYIDEATRLRAWNEYHEILCTGTKGKDHPLSKFVEMLKKLNRSNPLFIIRMMATIVTRLKQEYKRLLEANQESFSALKDEELEKAKRELRNRARLWAFEPFAMFVSNEESSPLEEEAVATLRTILGTTEFDDVVAVPTYRNLNGAILRNVQSLNPLSDLHLALAQLPHERQQAVVKEFDPKAESPLAFLENPFMKHLCIQGSGLFLLANSTNHSCDPNIISASSTNDYRVTMHALRDIKKGEELTISYIDENLPYETRQRQLKELYYFECKCPKCLLKL